MVSLWLGRSQILPHGHPDSGVRSLETLNEKVSESAGSGSILIVDDSVDCRLILRTVMEEEGYCCVEAPDGMAALLVCQEISIDFIITDFQMPHKNGCEFLEELSRKATGFPPSIMISAGLTEELRRRAVHAGALAVLSKPFDQKKILKIVREVMDCKPKALRRKDSISPSEIQ